MPQLMQEIERREHIPTTRNEEKIQKKKERKWTLGSLFRKKKVKESDTESSDSDAAESGKKVGFLARRRRKRRAANRGSKDVSQSFEHVIIRQGGSSVGTPGNSGSECRKSLKARVEANRDSLLKDSSSEDENSLQKSRMSRSNKRLSKDMNELTMKVMELESSPRSPRWTAKVVYCESSDYEARYTARTRSATPSPAQSPVAKVRHFTRPPRPQTNNSSIQNNTNLRPFQYQKSASFDIIPRHSPQNTQPKIPPPPPPRDPQRKIIPPLSYQQYDRPLSYAFENNSNNRNQQISKIITDHNSAYKVNSSGSLDQQMNCNNRLINGNNSLGRYPSKYKVYSTSALDQQTSYYKVNNNNSFDQQNYNKILSNGSLDQQTGHYKFNNSNPLDQQNQYRVNSTCSLDQQINYNHNHKINNNYGSLDLQNCYNDSRSLDNQKQYQYYTDQQPRSRRPIHITRNDQSYLSDSQVGRIRSSCDWRLLQRGSNSSLYDSSDSREGNQEVRPLSMVIENNENPSVTILSPEKVLAEQQKRKSGNLEDALNELEAIYKSLQLRDEDTVPHSRGFESDSGYNYSVNDDMAFRRLNRKDTESPDCRRVMSQAGSYLLISPTLSPPPFTGATPILTTQLNEPDITLDDVVYRNIRHTNNTLKISDPQPLFGIPLGPISPAPNSDYLHAAPKQVYRPTFKPRKTPDIVKDDLAYRNLRKDSQHDSLLITENNFLNDNPSLILKKKRAVRSLSANLLSIIQKENFSPVNNQSNNYNNTYSFDRDYFEKTHSYSELPDVLNTKYKRIYSMGDDSDITPRVSKLYSDAPVNTTSTETLTDSRANILSATAQELSCSTNNNNNNNKNNGELILPPRYNKSLPKTDFANKNKNRLPTLSNAYEMSSRNKKYLQNLNNDNQANDNSSDRYATQSPQHSNKVFNNCSYPSKAFRNVKIISTDVIDNKKSPSSYYSDSSDSHCKYPSDNYGVTDRSTTNNHSKDNIDFTNNYSPSPTVKDHSKNEITSTTKVVSSKSMPVYEYLGEENSEKYLSYKSNPDDSKCKKTDYTSHKFIDKEKVLKNDVGIQSNLKHPTTQEQFIQTDNIFNFSSNSSQIEDKHIISTNKVVTPCNKISGINVKNSKESLITNNTDENIKKHSTTGDKNPEMIIQADEVVNESVSNADLRQNKCNISGVTASEILNEITVSSTETNNKRQDKDIKCVTNTKLSEKRNNGTQKLKSLVSKVTGKNQPTSSSGSRTRNLLVRQVNMSHEKSHHKSDTKLVTNLDLPGNNNGSNKNINKPVSPRPRSANVSKNSSLMSVKNKPVPCPRLAAALTDKSPSNDSFNNKPKTPSPRLSVKSISSDNLQVKLPISKSSVNSDKSSNGSLSSTPSPRLSVKSSSTENIPVKPTRSSVTPDKSITKSTSPRLSSSTDNLELKSSTSKLLVTAEKSGTSNKTLSPRLKIKSISIDNIHPDDLPSNRSNTSSLFSQVPKTTVIKTHNSSSICYDVADSSGGGGGGGSSSNSKNNTLNKKEQDASTNKLINENNVEKELDKLLTEINNKQGEILNKQSKNNADKPTSDSNNSSLCKVTQHKPVRLTAFCINNDNIIENNETVVMPDDNNIVIGSSESMTDLLQELRRSLDQDFGSLSDSTPLIKDSMNENKSELNIVQNEGTSDYSLKESIESNIIEEEDKEVMEINRKALLELENSYNIDGNFTGTFNSSKTYLLNQIPEEKSIEKYETDNELMNSLTVNSLSENMIKEKFGSKNQEENKHDSDDSNAEYVKEICKTAYEITNFTNQINNNNNSVTTTKINSKHNSTSDGTISGMSSQSNETSIVSANDGNNTILWERPDTHNWNQNEGINQNTNNSKLENSPLNLHPSSLIMFCTYCITYFNQTVESDFLTILGILIAIISLMLLLIL